MPKFKVIRVVHNVKECTVEAGYEMEAINKAIDDNVWHEVEPLPVGRPYNYVAVEIK